MEGLCNMASCNYCKKPYYLDFRNGGRKLELDQKTPHRCISISMTQQPVDVRTARIDELALMKIQALNNISYAILDLAAAIREGAINNESLEIINQPERRN